MRLMGKVSRHYAQQCAGPRVQYPNTLALDTGDLNKPELGLAPEVYSRLAKEVDTIVHNGALVNHAFSYRELFEPNVLGTVEVMKLAVDTRVKAVTFLSSVSVVHGLDHPQPVTEEEVGTRLCTECPGDGGYALGCVWCLVSVCAPCSGTAHGPAFKAQRLHSTVFLTSVVSTLLTQPFPTRAGWKQPVRMCRGKVHAKGWRHGNRAS